uniref:ATARP8 n=1 Tax=Arundo donax TaxID=35708 RepID=A0A0A9F540_ARUDO
MVDQGIASMAGVSTLLLLGVVRHSWNSVTLNHLCMQGFITSSLQSIPGCK